MIKQYIWSWIPSEKLVLQCKVRFSLFQRRTVEMKVIKNNNNAMNSAVNNGSMLSIGLYILTTEITPETPLTAKLVRFCKFASTYI